MESKVSQRLEYKKQIVGIRKKDLVYIDESGLDNKCYKKRGWGKKGEIVLGKVSGKRIKCTNILADQCGK